jgi:hypothetical protein
MGEFFDGRSVLRCNVTANLAVVFHRGDAYMDRGHDRRWNPPPKRSSPKYPVTGFSEMVDREANVLRKQDQSTQSRILLVMDVRS